MNLATARTVLPSSDSRPVSEGVVIPRWFWLAAAMLAIAWFAPIQYRDLFHPDEGRYAEIPREMVLSGDWITPRLNDLKYFEKPPLQYWATAAAYVAFGQSEWSARLWPALLGFLGVAAVLVVGKTLFDLRTGMHAALILAGSLLFMLYAQVITLDMGLTFFLTASLSCFLLAMRVGLTLRQERTWIGCAWAAAALAVLSKGLIGVVLPGLTLLAYAAIYRDWRMLRVPLWPPAIAIFLAIASPWFALVQLRNPEFFDFFFIGEHVERFVLSGHHRPGAWYYFLPIVLIGMMPWTSVLLAAVPLALRRPQTDSNRVHIDRFLVLWVVVIVGFFSLSSSKLPGYVLPVFPALALLAARWTARVKPAQLRPHLLPGFAIAALTLIVVVAINPLTAHFPRLAEGRPLLPVLAIAGMLSLLSYVAARFLIDRGRITPAFAVIALVGVIAMQILQVGAQNLSWQYSTKDLINTARLQFGEFDPGAAFFSVGLYDQTLPLNLNRTVTLVDYTDEFSLGLRIEPRKGISTIDEFRQTWRQATRGYAVMSSSQYAKEMAAGTPMHLMARDPRLVLVQRQDGG
jgi:4-amino-4-deoxy-L-arabinose transferase-like glycosyltransferase